MDNEQRITMVTR